MPDMSKILVTGATGSVGQHVVSALLGQGRDVRALVRDPGTASLPGRVELVRGDLSSPETLTAALPGVESVYLMWPGVPVEPRVVRIIAEHAERVVYLSADVPDLADGEEPTIFHQEIERLIRQSEVNWTFVRAIDFATNTLRWAEQIKQGVVRLPYGQASRSLIHERDVADVVAHVLTSEGHDGAKYVITGPESIPQAELVRIIGEAIGREVRWEELPVDRAREALTAAWGDAGFVDGRLRAWAALVDAPERVTDTVQRLLGRPAMTFRAWAQEHAEAFATAPASRSAGASRSRSSAAPVLPRRLSPRQDVVWWYGGQMEIKTRAEDTGGALGVLEGRFPYRGYGPALHVHSREDEAIYVLEGQIRFRVGDDEFVAGPGACVWQPRGVPQAFSVESDSARVLIIFTPGGLERMFEDGGVPAAESAERPPQPQPAPETMAALATRFDFEFVGPQLADGSP